MSLSERYSRKGYYFLGLTLAVMAGGFALLHDIQKILFAVYIGVPTPLIIQKLSWGLIKISAGEAVTDIPKQRRAGKQKASTSEAK